MGDRKPDIVYIGYYKAGSTFLRSYMTYHPDIAWGRNVYRVLVGAGRMDQEMAPDQGASCYVEMFEGLALGGIFSEDADWKTVGFQPGGSVDRSQFDPDPEKVARRLMTAFPETKILVMIRNQVDWLRSNYIHHLRYLPKGQSGFRDFLTTPEGKRVLLAGQYHHTIELYRRLFGEDRVHVMVLEDVIQDQTRALRNFCRYADVPFIPFAETGERNEGKGTARGNAIRMGLRAPAWTKASWLRPARNLAIRMLDRDPISRNDREFLEAVYAASNAITSRRIGIQLADYGYPV